jgi:hypothetical protein
MANLAEFAPLCAIGNDGIGGVLASPVLRPIALLLRFVLADFDILIALKNRTAFGSFAVCGRDLNQLWLRRGLLVSLLPNVPQGFLSSDIKEDIDALC